MSAAATPKTEWIESQLDEILDDTGRGKPGSGVRFVQLGEHGVREILKQDHLQAVRDALKAGETVYEGWEADYPGLAPRKPRADRGW